MDLQLNGKRALLTGGSRGLGWAAARQLALEGCDLALAARGSEALRKAASELAEQTGRRVVPVVADTSDDASVAAMAEQASTELGGIDILVNCAARSAGASGAVTTVSAESLRTEYDVKALGYLRCAQAVLPQMIDRGWGRIINVAGLAARQSGAVSAAMRNAAIIALTKNLADAVGRHGITVTAVHPGVTRTDRVAQRMNSQAESRGVGVDQIAAEMGADYAIGRIVEPSEVGDVIAFLASPRSVAITGDLIACGGGRIGPIYH
jgi:NAD(P)-dependent dehydrogenase (short-subunit alcohol dehydrogenase family)